MASAWIRSASRRNSDLEAFGEALTAAVGFPIYPTDAPLHQNPIFAPETKRRFVNNPPRWATGGYPAAEQLFDELLVFPHAPLLAEPEAMADIVRAFDEVSGHFLE